MFADSCLKNSLKTRPDVLSLLMPVLRYGYLLPITVAIILGATNLISPTTESILRGVFVGIACGAIAIACLFTRGCIDEAVNEKVFLSVGMMVVAVMSSLFFNQPDLMYAMRGLLQISFIVALSLVLPVLLRRHPELRGEIDKTAKFFIYMTLSLIALAFYYHIMDLSYNPRLVHPLNPHLWALLSWLLAFAYFKNRLLSLVLAVAIIWTGSRFSVAMLGFALLFFSIHQNGGLSFKRVATALASIAVPVLILHVAMPQKSPLIPYIRYVDLLIPQDLSKELIQKTAKKNLTVQQAKKQSRDFSSNRKVIFPNALQKLHEPGAWWKGYAREVKVSVISPKTKQPEKVGVHNAFLRASLFYGIPFAILTYAVWFMRFMPEYMEDKISILFFWIVTLQSFLFSTFWTNMADPAVFFACLWLLSANTTTRKKDAVA